MKILLDLLNYLTHGSSDMKSMTNEDRKSNKKIEDEIKTIRDIIQKSVSS